MSLIYYNKKFPILRDMIYVLYEYCPSGGCCHIVTDDDNIYDDDLDFVIEYAQRKENVNRIDAELSIAICTILKSFSFLQRAVFFDSFYVCDNLNRYFDKKSFDNFYDSAVEEMEDE